MPQGIHKSARRSDKSPKAPVNAGRKTARVIYPAPLSQSERTSIEVWKENVMQASSIEISESQKRDAVVQAYLEAKLRLFQLSMARESVEEEQSDATSSASTKS